MDNVSRYISQIKFFGFEKNKKIQETSVAVIGLGGLGSWLSEFLVRIGVKNLAIVDFDIVEEKNLNRQNFIIDDIGKLKIDSIEKRLKEIDNNVNIEKYKEINSKIFNRDIVFDCTDNIRSKYLINELSVYYNKLYIFASVVMDQGFVGLINPKQFCLYDIYKGKEDLLTCDITGVDFSSIIFAVSLMLKLFINYVFGNRDGILYFNVKIIYKLCIWK